MKKIGIFFSLNTYGGVQTCIISLIKGLNQMSIIPDILSDEPINQKIIQEHQLQVNYHPIKFSISKENKDKYNSLLQGAIDLLYYYKTSWLDKDYDFLYIFQPNVIVNSKVKYMYYLSMSPRSPGYSGRQLLPRIKFFLYDYLIKYFIPVYEFKDRVDNCVINSKYTSLLFEQNYGKKISVVYPSNLVTIKEPIDYQKKDTVIFLSRIVRYKRPHLLINLAEKHPEINFEIIGAPEDMVYIDDLDSQIKSKGLLNIKIFTNLPYIQLQERLRRAKYYVFTAKDEHFGITTVEAMMYGVIPFVHDSGGQKEIVPFNELRFDDENFYEKFNLLINKSANEIMELQNLIQQHVKNFGEDVFISKMLHFINQH